MREFRGGKAYLASHTAHTRPDVAPNKGDAEGEDAEGAVRRRKTQCMVKVAGMHTPSLPPPSCRSPLTAHRAPSIVTLLARPCAGTLGLLYPLQCPLLYPLMHDGNTTVTRR